MENNDKKKKNIENALENKNKGTNVNTGVQSREEIMGKVIPDFKNINFIEKEIKEKKKKRNIIIALSLIGAAATIGGGIAIKNKISETRISGDMEYVEPKENNPESIPSDDDMLSGLVEQIDN